MVFWMTGLALRSAREVFLLILPGKKKCQNTEMRAFKVTVDSLMTCIDNTEPLSSPYGLIFSRSLRLALSYSKFPKISPRASPETQPYCFERPLFGVIPAV